MDVIGRYLFSTTLPGGYDLTNRLQAFFILWGMAIVSKEGAHITVDLFSSPKGRDEKSKDIVAKICCFTFFAAAGISAVLQIPKLYDSGERLAGMNLPAWPFQAVATLGLLLASVASLKRSQTRK